MKLLESVENVIISRCSTKPQNSLKNSLRPRFLDVGASRRIDDTGYLQDRTCIRELRYVVVALHGVYR